MLSPEQFRTLAALCDTLIPALEPPEGATGVERAFWRVTASELGVPPAFADALRLQPADKRQKLILLLNMLDKPTLAGVLTGYFTPFHELDFAARERILQRWAVSPIPELRQGFQALKRLAAALAFTLTNVDGTNPTWDAIRYPGPLPPAKPASEPLCTLDIRQPAALDCDVVIAGSGAGGSVVAAALAQAGYTVIILEKGDYVQEYSTREFEAFQQMYEQAGLLTTEDLGVVVLAGATLGGGTTINWAASFRTPDHVLHEWERDFGVAGLTGGGYQRSLDVVCDRLGVNTHAPHSRQTERLMRGCEALGYHHGVIPRNAVDCAQDECGWCCFGCVTGGKHGALKTWLADAQAAGAAIIVRAFAERVLIENGRAVGMTAWVKDTDGIEHPLTVRARVVVSAAGPLHSPALLMRSGLRNPNIGRHLRLHPTSPARGEYAEPIEMWRGPILTGYSAEFANQDGNHYGAIIEVPPAHSGLWASALNWRNARQFKEKMLRSAYQAGSIVITRETAAGRVTVDADGLPRLDYRLHPTDARHLITALIGSLRLHAAAGAHSLDIVHTDLPEFNLAASTPAQFEAYLAAVAAASRAPNRLGIYSAHQMGSVRMGANPDLAPLTPECETWEVRNLFTADASVFPTALGINPMITVMALAHRTAQAIKARL
jgi:choline dehydrogenase-like flavoprotein